MESGYGFSQRMLHRLALGSTLIARASYDFEGMFAGRSIGEQHRKQKHVFVSGLARSGTTVLMRRFYASGQFRSLTYQDMPFVLMPGTWKKLRGKADAGVARQRAHGDGIVEDFNSPVALEEVFWRVFAGSTYIKPDCLVPAEVPEEVQAMFCEYVGRILATDDSKRYLSKNNNNILRLPTIRKIFPSALLIVPFRDPPSHADSLLRQHQHFSKLHAEDPFSLQYMRWLAHHEFGKDHRDFRFDQQPKEWQDPADLNYWLESWIRTYRYLLDHAPGDVLFVAYESICNEQAATWLRLAELAEIDPQADNQAEPFTNKNREVSEPIDESLAGKARLLYSELVERSLSTIEA
ncbi:sulfotransferase family protein [bacterium]|nr:sulfotransferase family protein [bacterium]